VKPAKNILVYADGRVKEIAQPLIGMFYIEPELRDDGWYARKFQVEYAGVPDPKHPEELAAMTMVALERECVRRYTREEWDRMVEDGRAERQRSILDAILNGQGEHDPKRGRG